MPLIEADDFLKSELPKKGDHLFRKGVGFTNMKAADLRYWSREFSSFAYSFKFAADSLVDSALEGKQLPSGIAWPTLYLYRHAIELALKDCKAECEEFLDKKIAIAVDGKHDLRKYRDAVCELTQEIGIGEHTTESIGAFKILIDDLHALDKSGQQTRYPANNSGNKFPLPSGVEFVDLRELRRGIEKMWNFLSAALIEIHDRRYAEIGDL